MKIEKFFNKKEGKEQFRARFQLAGKEFEPKADSRKKLLEIVDEIRAQTHRAKYDLPTAEFSPSVSELFNRHKPKIEKPHQRKLFERVTRDFLDLLPAGIKIGELKKAHFQKYIDFRQKKGNYRTGARLNFDTINKELYALSGAFAHAPLYFSELDKYAKPEIPFVEGKPARRERLVDVENELRRLLAALRAGHRTKSAAESRRRIADDLEFRFETGMRRKEVARLKKRQYFPKDAALREVVRWKTGTVTKFFPLSRRAAEIIESRLRENPDSDYIFTVEGEANNGDYAALKIVAEKLGINYGKRKESGFILHDLRHNFATEIIRHTDIETAKNLTGHTGNEIFTYLHTDENKMRAAVRRREGLDRQRQLVEIYKAVRRGQIKARRFVELIGKIAEN